MKLYRLDYSPYARKVQMVLDLLGLHYEAIDVPFGNREELATVAGGYVQVPVLVGDDGVVTVDSRAICERLLQGDAAAKLVPSPWAGPIWAYADWCDNVLEDVLFRIASPRCRDRFASAWERGIYVFVKERKFGKGCVDEWERDTPKLTERGRAMLGPTIETLEVQPFLFGDRPTLADAALYGNCMMLAAVLPEMPRELSPVLANFCERLEGIARR